MTEAAKTVCFTCSLPIGEPLRLNHLPSGQVCPSCRDRLLDTLPPALPSMDGEMMEMDEVEMDEEEVSQGTPRLSAVEGPAPEMRPADPA